jgi:hypothetical protein
MHVLPQIYYIIVAELELRVAFIIYTANVTDEIPQMLPMKRHKCYR